MSSSSLYFVKVFFFVFSPPIFFSHALFLPFFRPHERTLLYLDVFLRDDDILNAQKKVCIYLSKSLNNNNRFCRVVASI